MIIPDVFSFILAGVALLHFMVSISAPESVFSLWHLLAGPILFLPFYLLWKVSDGAWLGLGDGKLALGIGWFLGLSAGTTAILFAFWIGAGISLILLFLERVLKNDTEAQLTMKSEIPFGPFLVLGTFLVYLFELNLFSYLLL